MNLERSLALNAASAMDAASEYLEGGPDVMLGDDFDVSEFNDAMNQKHIADWAVNTQLKNSYTTAKKIIDTI